MECAKYLLVVAGRGEQLNHLLSMRKNAVLPFDELLCMAEKVSTLPYLFLSLSLILLCFCLHAIISNTRCYRHACCCMDCVCYGRNTTVAVSDLFAEATNSLHNQVSLLEVLTKKDR